MSRPDHYPHYGHWPLHWPSSHPLLPGEATTGHRPIWEYLGLFWTGSGFMTNWSGRVGRGAGRDLDQLRHLITPPEMCPPPPPPLLPPRINAHWKNLPGPKCRVVVPWPVWSVVSPDQRASAGESGPQLLVGQQAITRSYSFVE